LKNQEIEEEIKISLDKKDEEYRKYLKITEIKKSFNEFHGNLFDFISLFNFNTSLNIFFFDQVEFFHFIIKIQKIKEKN
jgi:hypothetical protein